MRQLKLIIGRVLLIAAIIGVRSVKASLSIWMKLGDYASELVERNGADHV